MITILLKRSKDDSFESSCICIRYREADEEDDDDVSIGGKNLLCDYLGLTSVSTSK